MTESLSPRLETDHGSSFALVIMLTAFILGSAGVLINAAQEYVFEQRLISLTQQIALATKSITANSEVAANRSLTEIASALLADFDGKSPADALVKSATIPDGKTVNLVLCATFDAPFKMAFAPPSQMCEEARAR